MAGAAVSLGCMPTRSRTEMGKDIGYWMWEGRRSIQGRQEQAVSRSKFVEGVERHGRKIGAEELAGPPGAGLAFLFGGGKAVPIEERANEGGCRIGEGVRAHEAEESAVVGEESLDEVEEPAAVAGDADSAGCDND